MLIIKVTLEIRMLKSESRISTNVLQLEFRSEKVMRDIEYQAARE